MHPATPSVTRHLAELAAEQTIKRARRMGSRNTDTARWYVAHNGGGRDEHAKETLERANFEVYYPAESIMRLVPRNQLSQKQRRSMIPVYKRVLKPLFPRYFFVHFDLAWADWREAFELAGLYGIIYTDESRFPLPAPVSDVIIERIRKKEVNGAVPATTLVYEIGEEVRIKDGPFGGHKATVDMMPEQQIGTLDESARLKLLVTLFGRKSVVEMPLASIEKIKVASHPK